MVKSVDDFSRTLMISPEHRRSDEATRQLILDWKLKSRKSSLGNTSPHDLVPDVRDNNAQAFSRTLKTALENSHSLLSKRGRITKLPCEVCQSAAVDMHHDDYCDALCPRPRGNDYEGAAYHCCRLLFGICLGANRGAQDWKVAPASKTTSADGL
jgi:hypothetical protein